MRFLLVLVLLAPLAGNAKAASLTLACLDVGRMIEACRANAAAFTAETGHQVRVVAANATERLALEQYEALFSIESPRLDVIQFPDSWVAAIAEDLEPLGSVQQPQPFIPATLQGGVTAGRWVGWPQHLAITVLFLRSDVVAQGADLWSSLRDRLVAGESDGATRVSLGGADPALFSFFVDWLYGIGGQSLGDRVAVKRALTLLAEFLGPVAVPGASQMPTSDATASFTGGDSGALIARSTQASAVRESDEAETITERPLPSFREGPDDAAVLVTTWYVGASRYSQEREAALDLAAYLASGPVQRKNALDYGLAPTRTDLYSDAEVLATGPVVRQVSELIGRLAGPPAAIYGEAYLDLADSVADNVRGVLRGELDVDQATNAVLRAVRRADRVRTN